MKSAALLFALISATASAQTTVCVSGVIQPVSGASFCMQGETHRLDGTLVYLKSRTLNLAQWNGQLVHVTGIDISVTCAVLDVTQVAPARATLATCGSSSVGCPQKLKVCPVGMGSWFLFASVWPGYRPIGCQGLPWSVDGTVLIGTPAATLGSGFGGLCGEVIVPVPMSNALTGLEVWFQGARRDIGPVGPWELTNAVRIRLAPFMPPCAPTNC